MPLRQLLSIILFFAMSVKKNNNKKNIFKVKSITATGNMKRSLFKHSILYASNPRILLQNISIQVTATLSFSHLIRRNTRHEETSIRKQQICLVAPPDLAIHKNIVFLLNCPRPRLTSLKQ